MPKVDLRTYIALERAFVRRLQRSWRIQSAPIYAAIAQACTEHKWDEARRQVTNLDMTEVGTENREWITYMLLSCAVFGANIVAKGKPSFVGVGSFDTFLKQTTNNMLQYLEYRGTSQVQAEALQSIAEDEAKTKALGLKWDESKHPRDKEGQFTEAGGGTQRAAAMEGGGPERAKWEALNQSLMAADDVAYEAKKVFEEVVERIRPKYTDHRDQLSTDPEYQAAFKAHEDAKQRVAEAEAAYLAQAPAMRKEVVTNLAMGVAKDLGVGTWHITVVDHEAKKFTVGGREFVEGAHYTPVDEEIVVNAHEMAYGDAAAVKGIVAHEISHFMYHTMKGVAEQEKRRYQAKPAVSFAEINTDYPATKVLSILANGHMFNPGISKEMIAENGHSAYAKSYWTPEAIAEKGGYESAINETMAEITRYITHPQSWSEKTTPSPDSPWVKLTQGMHAWYAARQTRIAAMQQKARA